MRSIRLHLTIQGQPSAAVFTTLATVGRDFDCRPRASHFVVSGSADTGAGYGWESHFRCGVLQWFKHDPALADSFVRSLDLIRRQHLVLVNMLQPPGAVPLFTGPNVTAVDDLYGRLGGHLRWQNLRELQKVLQRRGIQFSLLANERLSAELVSQYLSVKQRQLL